MRRKTIEKITVAGITVVVAAAALYLLLPRRSSSPTPDLKSIAVLSFESLDAGRREEYFSDGVTREITARLSKIADLRVAPYDSMVLYHGGNTDLSIVGGQLRVASIVEGTVRRFDKRVQITCRLVDARTNEQLWAETYDRELSGIFEIQSEVAREIARALGATVTSEETAQIRAAPTNSLEAYDYYLRGRYSCSRYSKENNEIAISLFKKALLYDPDYAAAYAGLGDAFAQRVLDLDAEREWLDAAIQAGERAVAMDANLAEGYHTLARTYTAKGWLKKALAANLKVFELDPNHMPDAVTPGWIYVRLRRPDRAIAWLKNAPRPDLYARRLEIGMGAAYAQLAEFEEARCRLELKPTARPDADAFVTRAILVATYIAERRYDDAKSLAEELMSSQPAFAGGYLLSAWVEAFEGDINRAKILLEAATHTVADGDVFLKPLTECYLACAMCKLGNREKASRFIAQSSSFLGNAIDDGNEAVEFYEALAMLEAVQDNKTGALDWLQRAFDAGYIDYLLAEQNPFLDTLHDNAKFKELMSQMRARVEDMRRRVGEHNS
jgi:TolB-like protein